MAHVLHVLGRQITSRAFDIRVGKTGCFLGALVVLGLGILKLAALEMTEGERFVGLMGVLSVFLLCVIPGVVLESSPLGTGPQPKMIA